MPSYPPPGPTGPGGDYTGAYDADGDLTGAVAHPGNGRPDQGTAYLYDGRDRLATEYDGLTPGTANTVRAITYDNLGRATAVRQYANGTAGQSTYTSGGVTYIDDYGLYQPGGDNAGLLRAQAEYAYDDQGRVYRATAYAVDPTTGAVGPADATDTFYDGRGDALATRSPAGLWAKAAYDGAGRLTAAYAAVHGATGYAGAAGLGTDTVLTQARYTYDADGNRTGTVTGDRFGTDPEYATGAVTYGGYNAGRLSYSAAYYDAADRPTAAVDVGTNGGSLWARPATPPARSDAALVTSYAYDPAGYVAAATDPRGLVTAYQYDARGRTTRTVANVQGDGTPTASTNQTTAYAYDPSGHVVTYTAVLPAGQPSQTTHYVYGVTTAGGSGANDNDALAAVQYPDPDTGTVMGPTYAQQETYAYDALGERTGMTDRNGTAHGYTYDAQGRLTADAVTAFGAGVDPSASLLAYAYDDAGRVRSATTYAGTTAGPGTVTNQDTRTYDGFGRLAAERQAVAGLADGSTPTVGYARDAANGDRLTGLVYPDGRTLTYGYGPAGSLTSLAGQVTGLSDAAGPVQSYTYLGLSRPVTFAGGNGVTLSYLSANGSTADAGDIVTGLDRFGRVVDQKWAYASGLIADEQRYTYDRDSNVLTRRDTVLPGQSQAYTYDGLNRLTTFARGTLNAAGTAVAGTAAGTESWAYDAVGNWDANTKDGTTTTRTNNAQNQIKTVGGVTLAYDRNGNTLIDDKGQRYTYDAWNRLVTVKDAAGATLAAYAYDAQDRRITETHGGATTALYYSDRGQVVEERSGTAPAAVVTAQNVWSAFYVNDQVARDDHAPGTAGTALNRRLYPTHDANFNATALTDATGVAVERYAYSAYGRVTVLTAAGVVVGTGVGSSVYANRYLFQGGRSDPATGLGRFGVRDYGPGQGRWLEQDPAGYVDGADRYQFVCSSPIYLIDPYGLWTFGGVFSSIGHVVASGVSGAIGGAITGAITGGLAGLITGPGFLVGATAGAAAGLVAGGITGTISGLEGEIAGNATFGSAAANGLITGAISGAAAGVIPGAGLGDSLGTRLIVNGVAGSAASAAAAGYGGACKKGVAAAALIGLVGGIAIGNADLGDANSVIIGFIYGVDVGLLGDAIAAGAPSKT